MPHSESTENYLTEILRLQQAGTKATTSLLAERLGVARPSVTGMLKKLDRDGLVTHQRYIGVALTPSGHDLAVTVLHRHRLVETFLVEILDFSPDAVHDEAHRLEHALSDEVVRRLDAWLGHPAVDPHGTPIPRLGAEPSGDPS